MKFNKKFIVGLTYLLFWNILFMIAWIVIAIDNFERETNHYHANQIHRPYLKHSRLTAMEPKYNLTALELKLDKALKLADKKANILVWSQPAHKPSPSSTFNLSECGVCEVVYNKKLVDDPDTKAVVFHVVDREVDDLPKPRRIDQYYVWWSEESPSSTILERLPTEKHDHAFNLTMSYRQDSDVFSPYGTSVWTLSKMAKNNPGNRLETINDLMQKKKKLALWVVSNCEYTAGARGRMKLVKQLIHAGLDIDLGGKCFPHGVKEWKFEEYKFYFALENSVHCRDYITEKFYHNALEHGAVPIVYGPDEIDYHEPTAFNNSYIYATNYTVKELVKYLNYLDKNDTAYMKYLEWRNVPISSTPERRRATGFCHLCRMIHGIYFDNIFNPKNETTVSNLSLFSEKQELKTVKSVTSWWYGTENANCIPPTIMSSMKMAIVICIEQKSFLLFCGLVLLYFIYFSIVNILKSSHNN